MKKEGKLTVLFAVLMIALAGAIWYNWSASGTYRQPAATRTGFDFEVTWRCLETGYEEQAPAAMGARTNPNTQEATMYACFIYASPAGEQYPVYYDYGDNGFPKLIKIGPDGEWKPVREPDGTYNIVDPETGERLTPLAAGGPRT